MIILQILIGLSALALLVIGGRWFFAAEGMMEEHDIQAISPTGKNYLRGDVGGLLIGGGIMAVLYLVQGSDQWVWPLTILLATVIVGRAISLLVDGYSKQGLQAIIIEILMIALLVGYHYWS